MDVKALAHNPEDPVEKRQPAEPKVSKSVSGEPRPLRGGSEAGPSRVEPVQRRPRIKVFVDEDTGRPAFLVIDDETGEAIRRCCEELKGQMELVEELREATSRRKAELLEDMGILIKQDQAAKEYGGFRPGLDVTARAESKPNVLGGVGRRKESRSGNWDQRRLVLYG